MSAPPMKTVMQGRRAARESARHLFCRDTLACGWRPARLAHAAARRRRRMQLEPTRRMAAFAADGHGRAQA